MKDSDMNDIANENISNHSNEVNTQRSEPIRQFN
jgi:hypothetical protein